VEHETLARRARPEAEPCEILAIGRSGSRPRQPKLINPGDAFDSSEKEQIATGTFDDYR